MPVGVTYVWVASNLLWLMLSEAAELARKWLVKYDVCGMTDLGTQRVLKEFETAVRRTGRWDDWRRMSVSMMGQIGNANLFIGRGRFAVVWAPGFENRCDA